MNEFIHIEDNKGLFANGIYSECFHLVLPEKYALGQEDYLELNSSWEKALKDLPSGTIFYKQDAIIKKKFNTKDFPSENFLQKSTKNYFKDVDYKEHACFLFFILPNKELLNTNLSNPFKKVDKTAFFGFDDKILHFSNSVKETINSLKSIRLTGNNKFDVIPFESWQVKSYYDTYYNLFNDDFISDRFFNKSSIQIGNKYAAMVCQVDEKKFPESLAKFKKDKIYSSDTSVFYRNNADNFTFDLDFSHLYNQILYIDSPDKHLNELRLRNDKLHKSASFDRSNLEFAKQTDEIITDLVTNSDSIKLIRGHNNVIVIASDETELETNLYKVIEQFKELDIKPYVPTGNYLNAIFNYSFPFFSHYFTDKQLYVSSLEIFCSFINNTGTYKNDTEGITYNSRIDNVPVVVDTWDDKKKYVKARNFFILAPTGFGKSFNANHIISYYFSINVKVVIIDLGGSYRKLSALFPNKTAYISYEQGVSMGVNPFDLDSSSYTEENKLNNDKLDELVEFVGVHFKRDTLLNEIERASLRKLIETYYKKNSGDYSLPNFVLFVKNNPKLLSLLSIKDEFFNRDEFLHLMEEFIDGGIYDYLYKETATTIDKNLHDKSIVVFELDKVKDNALLLAIMLQLVSTTIDNVIWRDKKNKGIVLFDEIAEQLKWNGVLGRVQFFFQAIRKQNGAVGIVLQSESQLPDNNLSKAIVENTQILYVLGAKDYRSLQKRFDLSEHAYYQLASIRSDFSAEKPWSEIFILREKNHQVYRLEVSKEVYWAYQTEGAKNEELLELYKEVGNMETAITTFINKS
ncbi:VirB4 family type IV secretion system protein [Mariniflexile fucanivorans]|nr:DUF87 domain-containing protein [Mariniflexile fucanivorans]